MQNLARCEMECTRPGRSNVRMAAGVTFSGALEWFTLLRPGTGALRPGPSRAKADCQTSAKKNAAFG